jgi:hypothetical protein
MPSAWPDGKQPRNDLDGPGLVGKQLERCAARAGLKRVAAVGVGINGAQLLDVVQAARA